MHTAYCCGGYQRRNMRPRRAVIRKLRRCAKLERGALDMVEFWTSDGVDVLSSSLDRVSFQIPKK